jgi:hypothetical protein
MNIAFFCIEDKKPLCFDIFQRGTFEEVDGPFHMQRSRINFLDYIIRKR